MLTIPVTVLLACPLLAPTMHPLSIPFLVMALFFWRQWGCFGLSRVELYGGVALDRKQIVWAMFLSFFSL